MRLSSLHFQRLSFSQPLRQHPQFAQQRIHAGEPHGFMLQNGELRQDDVAKDAFNEMADYFDRKLAIE